MNPRGRSQLTSPYASQRGKRAPLPPAAGLGTGNPALDLFLEGVRERLEVLDGSRANPQEAAVTERRLAQLGLTAGQQTVTVSSGGSIVVRDANGSYGVLSPDQFAESIRGTRLIKSLTTRVEDLSRFDRFGGEIQELKAQAEGATASLRELRIAYATADQAVAGKITQVSARLDDFGGDGVTIEQAFLAEVDRTDGLYAEYYLKLDVNGKISGYGLASDEESSAFIIAADKFAIVSTTDTIADPLNPPANRIPFGVDTGTSTIYLNGQVRINAAGPSFEEAAQLIGIEVTPSEPQWKVDTTGAAVNASITLTATLRGSLTGFVTWSKSGTGTTPPTAGTTNTWTIYAADQSGESTNYTATLVFGGITYTKTVTIARVRDGVKGDRGDTGALGSLTGYGSAYSISTASWSDTLANRVIYNMLTGETSSAPVSDTDHLMIGDTVTLSNGTDFASTKYWDGTAWIAPGVVIDGNLLVNGTVSADKITAGEVVAGQSGNVLVKIGDYTFFGSINSAFHTEKLSAASNQVLISALNDQDDSAAIWGASVATNGNAVTGTWHSSTTESNAGRWQMIGALGSDLFDGAVAGNAYGTMQGGAFRYYSGSNSASAGSIVTAAGLATSTHAGVFAGPVELTGTGSALRLNGSDGSSGQVPVSNGSSQTPTWTTLPKAQGGAGTADGSGNLSISFSPSFSGSFGVSAISTSGVAVVVTSISGSGATLQAQSLTTGAAVPSAGIRWVAVGT